MSRKRAATRSPPYQIFMLVLCLYSLATLTIQAVVKLDAETRAILDYADNVVCLFFFIDFLRSLMLEDNRLRYMYTWGWIDLASSIPTVDLVRWGRAARVVRIFRVLRGLRATKMLATLVLEKRAESAFLTAGLVALLLVLASSISILQFESVTGETFRARKMRSGGRSQRSPPWDTATDIRSPPKEDSLRRSSWLQESASSARSPRSWRHGFLRRAPRRRSARSIPSSRSFGRSESFSSVIARTPADDSVPPAPTLSFR